jgi:hypothetical protein
VEKKRGILEILLDSILREKHQQEKGEKRNSTTVIYLI